jgi:hypothetical protein
MATCCEGRLQLLPPMVAATAKVDRRCYKVCHHALPLLVCWEGRPPPLPMVTTLSIVPKSRFHKFVSTLFIVFLLVFSNHGLTRELIFEQSCVYRVPICTYVVVNVSTEHPRVQHMHTFLNVATIAVRPSPDARRCALRSNRSRPCESVRIVL